MIESIGLTGLGVRFHGRGGQGAVVASKILAKAYFRQGLFVQAFPAFGMERRGAPVAAFVRVDSAPILARGEVGIPIFQWFWIQNCWNS